ncbi:MAG: hypothetical protein AAGB04_00225 [Pseudomonadota bacterium]
METIKLLINENQAAILSAIAAFAAYLNRDKLPLPKKTTDQTPVVVPSGDRDLEDVRAIKRLIQRANETGNERLLACANECLQCLFDSPETEEPPATE